MKVANVSIIDQNKLVEGDNKGWIFRWEEVYDSTTVSTEKQTEIWISDYDEARAEFLKGKNLV